jgi:putative hemolysin
MPDPSLILLALLPLLLGLAAFCSAAETALFSLTQGDLLRLRKAHPSAHHSIGQLLREPRSLLVAILLANVVGNTAFFTIAALAGRRLFDAVGAAGFGVGCVLMMIALGEVVPKAVAAVHRVLVSRLVALPLLAWFSLVTPVRVAIDRLVIAPMARVFRPQATQRERLTAEELSGLIELAARQGVLHESEQQLLADVVQLSALRVRDIMIPRVDVRWLDAVATSQELLQIARDTGWTRFPVCRGRFDDRQIVGLVSAQRVLPKLARQGASARVALAALVEPPQFVPERARVDQLLDFFRERSCDAALVVSESGAITGLVQIDNVIGVLVTFAGSADELPEQQVRMVGLGEWQVPGRLSVRDWQEYFDPQAFDGAPARVSTVAGLILSKLGRLPRAGDHVDVGNLRLRVESVSGRMIERVLVSVAADRASMGAPPERAMPATAKERA